MLTRPPKLTDPEAVQKVVDDYFREREEQQEVLLLKNGDVKISRTPPSVIGLCRKLGISHDAFDDYLEGSSEAYNSQISEILRDAKSRIIEELVEGVSRGWWTEKICLAMLTRYGVIGNEEQQQTVRIIMQGQDQWSK